MADKTQEQLIDELLKEYKGRVRNGFVLCFFEFL